MSAMKGIPLRKDEVALLLDLIEGHKVVVSKATDAKNNYLKEKAWSQITNAFNALINSGPRKTDQLRLKWENLKKAARKRSAQIMASKVESEGGKLDYVPLDVILDRVSSMLVAINDCHKATADGDSDAIQSQSKNNTNSDGDGSDDGNDEEGNDDDNGSNDGIDEGNDVEMVKHEVDNEDDIVITTTDPCNDTLDFNPSNGQLVSRTRKRKFISRAPLVNSAVKRRQKLLEEDLKCRIARNQAIAEYYNMKKIKLQLEIQKFKHDNKL